MGQAAINYMGVKGGMKLNDIIEEFKYVYKGQTLSAGNFVEYVNGTSGEITTETSVDIQTNSNTQHTSKTKSAVLLPNGDVFIAYAPYTTGNYLRGVLLEINGTEIIQKLDTQLGGTTNTSVTGSQIHSVLLPSGKIFTVYGSGDYRPLYGVVITITGNTIVASTPKKMVNTNYTSDEMSLTVLPDGKVFMGYTDSNMQNTLCAIVTIDNDTITVGTSLTITNGLNSIPSTCLLKNGKVFVLYKTDSSHFYATVCTIDGTTITKGTEVILSEKTGAGRIASATTLDNGNVFIAYNYNSNNSVFCGVICNIVDSMITVGEFVSLGTSGITSGYRLSAITLDNGSVFIAYNSIQDQVYLYGMVCAVNDMTITKGTEIQISSISYSGYLAIPILLQNKNIFIYHSYNADNYYPHCQIIGVVNNTPTNQVPIPTYETQVRLCTTANADAIALSSGTGGTDTAHNQQVKIARPI